MSSSSDATPAASAALSPEDEAKVESFKDAGNEHFKARRFQSAIDSYTAAIELRESAALLSNRAFAHLKMEAFGLAITDATRAIELEPDFAKGYYRRGSAHVGLCKFKEAMKDFRAVVEKNPKSKDARKKYAECNKELKRQAFERAIASEHTKPPSETVSLDSMMVEAGYDGPRLEGGAESITREFVMAMVERFRDQKLVHKKYVAQMLVALSAQLRKLPSLVEFEVPADNGAGESGTITVCGDTHGQYYDLLNIFDMNGYPSETNPYLFNGDFVDRGSFSVENVLTLFAFKLLYPQHMHLTRGNHETVNMNKIYGFEGEVKHKYNDVIMSLFTEVFQWLPIACCINRKVLVVHGGLPQTDGVTLADIRAIPRGHEPPESGLMSDLLWSDPQPFQGRGPSKRGVGKSFGPDITAKFLDENNLSMLIRSHEVKEEGYVVEHDGRCVTVFSAPNYCDQMGNNGAFVKIDADSKPMYVQFEAVPHPPVKPMAYAANMFNQFGLGM